MKGYAEWEEGHRWQKEPYKPASCSCGKWTHPNKKWREAMRAHGDHVDQEWQKYSKEGI